MKTYISVARAGASDSASAFGHVAEKIEIVDKICENTPVQDDNGTVAPNDRPVIASVKVID